MAAKVCFCILESLRIEWWNPTSKKYQTKILLLYKALLQRMTIGVGGFLLIKLTMVSESRFSENSICLSYDPFQTSGYTTKQVREHL